MTPAINLLRKTRTEHSVHEYQHDASSESFGLEAAEKLGIEPERVFKTLVVKLDSGQMAVGIVAVSSMLSLKRIAKACGAKKAVMASPPDVERTTGYVLGGVSPLGQKRRLKTVIDASASHFDTVFVSAGKRGMDIELKPGDLASLVNAGFAEIRQ
ncbi:MAG: Cys-tRNA(Pro) deacylase [Xanthomonadales bacterium]|jgi:Cys-tRNA(Pro)/Cys-tRNA(Cys) deacylase|nr:Cys-tRNA(Pro) deacylase [Xanthomonadales bacterium]